MIPIQVSNCSLCENALGSHFGLIGSNYENSRLLFLLHVADKRIIDKDYSSVLFKTATGEILEKILSKTSFGFEDVAITNLVKCFFGKEISQNQGLCDVTYIKEINPSKKVYENCISIFNSQLEKLNSRAIVAFGKEPFEKLSGVNDKNEKIIWNKEGVVDKYNNIPIFYSVHPSNIWAMKNNLKIENYLSHVIDFIEENNVVNCKNIKNSFYDNYQIKLF